MPDRILKIPSGTFRITIHDDIQIDFETRQRKSIGTLLSIGGKNTCIFMKLPHIGVIGTFEQLNTKKGGCEVYNKVIKGAATMEMVRLAFTIVKEVAPHIQILRLQDASDIDCKMPDGSTMSISLALFELAFYQKTYYERHFGAYLENPALRELYNTSIPSFYSKKPETYEFHNKYLNMYLQKPWKETKTWKEFFDTLANDFNAPDITMKCQMVAPWIRNAIGDIMSSISFERQYWLIDLDRQEGVEYQEQKQQGGSKRGRTRKLVYTRNRKDPEGMLYESMYSMKFPFLPLKSLVEKRSALYD